MQWQEPTMRKQVSRLALSAAITFSSVAAAQAYSDEAIRSAEEILGSTNKRFQFGEVDRSDVALATYNVLDMRLKAGKLDPAAFCKAAKPELAAVAAGFQPEAGQADAMKAWLDAIAGMGGDQAKCREASAATERLLYDTSPADYSDAGLKNARDVVTATAHRRAVGEATAIDLAAARSALLEVRHGMKAMAHGAYCQTGVPLLQQIASGTEEEAGMGQRSLADVIAAERRLHAAMAQCAGELHGDVKEILSISRRAADHASRKEFDGAIADYTEVLRLAPQNAAALRGRGDAYVAKNDNGHAEADYSAALALDPTDVDVLSARGELRYGKADNDGAIADYSALLALAPDDVNARIGRGSASFAKRDYAGAIADFTIAIDNGPSVSPLFPYSPAMKYVLTNRAYAYAVQRDYDHAIADYTRLLRFAPRDPDIFARRANSYYAKQDYDHAIADLTAVIELDAKNAAARFTRAAAYVAKADYRDAIADYSEAIRLDPRNADALIQRGSSYEQIKDYAHAIADDSAAIGLDANNADAFNARCWHRAIGGHLGEALSDCDTSLRLRPGDANTLDSRGFVHLMLGELDGAIADYDAALKAQPKLATALYGRGLARRRKSDAAGGEKDIAAAKAIEAGVAERFAEYGAR
jgi:tetratricopeptide (TPR) repeat protein